MSGQGFVLVDELCSCRDGGLRFGVGDPVPRWTTAFRRPTRSGLMRSGTVMPSSRARPRRGPSILVRSVSAWTIWDEAAPAMPAGVSVTP